MYVYGTLNMGSLLYSQINIKEIERGWDKFFVASVGVGTASQKKLNQSRSIVSCIHFIQY